VDPGRPERFRIGSTDRIGFGINFSVSGRNPERVAVTRSASVSDDVVDTDPVIDDIAPGRSRLVIILLIVIVVAAVIGAGTTGWLVANRSPSGAVSATSVDAGFARDMSNHHTQAVVMAGYARLHTTNASVLLLANDIYDDQTFEIGEMQGWLDTWGLSRSTTIPAMSWMSGHTLDADGLMPGMATPAEISKLQSLTGNALDIDFLQLMIRHHQGGLQMEQYAATHAAKSYVRDLANRMLQAQGSEIISMEQLLRQLGGTPLASPS
jgi:uncharacterized protein (DUF305 family)